jgi:hypothetical protein
VARGKREWRRSVICCGRSWPPIVRHEGDPAPRVRLSSGWGRADRACAGPGDRARSARDRGRRS